MYNFDTYIDRSHSESTKWDRYRDQQKNEKFIPLWLADMDVPVSNEIHEAIMNRAKHPIYGYTDRSDLYPQLFADRFNKRYQYDVTKQQTILSTGVMYSISAALRLFTKEDDHILILRPCYHPFVDMTLNNQRVPHFVDMMDNENGYEIDFHALEAAAATCKAIILCNPHNPTGRVFTKDELTKIANICEQHQLLIISDEIHCDFIYEGHIFQPIMNISEYTKQHTIACVSPTKSFNLAGLKISAVFIKNEKMLTAFREYAQATGISSINLFAMEALKAAYLNSAQWQKELLEYLHGNREIVEKFLHRYENYCSYHVPEGTYFYWIKFHESDGNIHDTLLAHHVILNDGKEFSENCHGFERLNFACPRPLLLEGLEKIEEVLIERKNI